MQKLIIDRLQNPPFNKSLNLINLISEQTIVPIIHEVILYIEKSNTYSSQKVDLKTEEKAATASRICNFMRMMNYKGE
jgi:hypothetical protein